ncbi:MAG: alpha/beta fold hydrolase [Spirochaetes bacterium]|nr:MAG: alpha/beta fold hydrolase [Spirochaetota bacterium]
MRHPHLCWSETGMKKILAVLVSVILGVPLLTGIAYGIYFAATYPRYSYDYRKLPARFEEFYALKQARSRDLGARPGNEERLVRHAPGKTPLAFLYLHGFSGSRIDGEDCVDSVAARYGANAYYLRFPGHGTNKEDQASRSFDEYLDEAADALRMMRLLGDKTIVVGTSMGGLVATYLAAAFPDLVDGAVLCSPFYEYVDPLFKWFEIPGGRYVVEREKGPINYPKTKPPATGWSTHFYAEKYYSSYVSLSDLKRCASRDELFRRIRAPVLLLYYYKDEQNQDVYASVPAMLAAFELFGLDSGRSPLTRKLRVENGSHAMLSVWQIPDRPLVEQAIVDFAGEVAAARSPGRE